MAENKKRFRAKSYTFTWNNYEPKDCEYLVSLVPEKAAYVLFGKEVGDKENTPHLQGMICFQSNREFNTVKKLLPKCHIEKMRGTLGQCQDYCKKDSEYTEAGKPPPGQGARTDIIELANRWRENKSYIGMRDEPTWYQFMKRIIEQVKMEEEETNIDMAKKEFTEVTLYKWQESVLKLLMQKPDSRRVIWVYDTVGNTGKSWFSKFLVARHGAIRMENGRNADVKHAYNGQQIVIFDYSRSVEGRINYEVIESIKNGLFFSSKYNSSMKIFNSPHILCLANFKPEIEKLSQDRWYIKEIGKAGSYIENPQYWDNQSEYADKEYTTEKTTLVYR